MSITTIQARFDGDGIARLIAGMDRLHNRTPDALRRALNHTGDKARTAVKSALGKQIGAPQAALVKYGGFRSVRANFARLDYQIVADGGPIPLKHFRARQTKKGVTAAPWNNRKLYKSAFIVDRLGGHAFWRTGKKRLPIERIAGPNVPKELLKDQSLAAFHAASQALPGRVAHEIKAITNGIVS